MNLLLLTVGTGTSGKYSNIAEGLVTSIRMLKPEKFWLVPSASENSILVADLIKEAVENKFPFVAWDSHTPYHTISHPDCLEDCRQTILEVIQRIKSEKQKEDKLLINPTSGTKQMSIGATLAALDESIGEIVFTVGERKDGVVQTGKEKLTTFDANHFYRERDLNLARELATSGALTAAKTVLASHSSLKEAYDVVSCLYEWERLYYEAARQIAASSSSPQLKEIRALLTNLSQQAASQKPSADIVRDILQTADIYFQREDYENALSYGCKALEMGLRLSLFLTTDLFPPYAMDALRQLDVGRDIIEKYERNSDKRGICYIGLKELSQLLSAMNDPIGEGYHKNKSLHRLINTRNEMTHSIRHVNRDEASQLLTEVRQLLSPLIQQHLPSYSRPHL